VGARTLSAALDPIELAAYAVTVNTILNLDEAKMRS
jgi:hypothetical protein